MRFLPVFMFPHPLNGPAGVSGVSVLSHVVVEFLFDPDHAKARAFVLVWLAIAGSRLSSVSVIPTSVNHGPSGPLLDSAQPLAVPVNTRELGHVFHIVKTA